MFKARPERIRESAQRNAVIEEPKAAIVFEPSTERSHLPACLHSATLVTIPMQPPSGIATRTEQRMSYLCCAWFSANISRRQGSVDSRLRFFDQMPGLVIDELTAAQMTTRLVFKDQTGGLVVFIVDVISVVASGAEYKASLPSTPQV